jgi:hypothetical protein
MKSPEFENPDYAMEGPKAMMEGPRHRRTGVRENRGTGSLPGLAIKRSGRGSSPRNVRQSEMTEVGQAVVPCLAITLEAGG